MSLLGGIAHLLVLAYGAQGTPAQAGQWGPLLEWGIQGKHMVMLHTGDVLVWSTGENARVWDPDTGSFTLVPATFGDLHCAGHVTLPDGRVIVLGGVNGDPHIGTTITAMFDPVAMRWTLGRPMNFARWYASVTALPDGRVLVTSGDNGTGERVLTPEIYNPVTNTWVVLTGAVRDQSLYPLMYVLPDGRVYESGPKTSTAFLNMNGAGSWSAGPPNLYSTSGYSESSVMYAPGKILRAGGDDPAIARSSVLDMTVAAPQWKDTDSLNFARRRLNLVILADGKCLAVGGTGEADSETKAVLQSEIWDPATGLWTVVSSLSEPRMYHSTAILMPDGRVVTAGGEAEGRMRAQVYSPPYLFQGARPVIGSAPSEAAYGSTFEIVTADAASIASVAFLRPSAATHAWDQNQRYVPLSFTPSAGRLSVSAPATAGSAPPGYYMLVIKNQSGVPSVARFVRVASASDLAPGAVRGTVTAASSGAPIPGATVSTSERTTTSSGNGSYLLDPMTSGEHLVTFSAPGYASQTRQVDVVGGTTATLDASLVLPGTVRGRVTDASTGQALTGALLFCAGLSTTTDSAGGFELAGIPSGTQSMTASASGYVSLQRSAAVPANGSLTLDFALVRNATYIAGLVIDSLTSEAIVGALVSYPGGSTTSDSLGRYRFDDVPPGTHRVTASASGHVSQTVDVVVTSGTASFHDFGLVALGSARIKDITFEGGSLTNPSNGADVIKGVMSLETLQPLAGRYSARVNAADSCVEESFAATDELFLAFTFSLRSLPPSDVRIARITNSGTTVGNVQLRTSGRLRLRVGTTNVGVETAPLVVGRSYRLGLHQRRGTGANAVLEAFLSEAGVPFGPSFAATGTGAWTTAASRLQVGATSNNVANLVLDDIFLDGASMPGGGGPVLPVAAFTASPTSGPAPLAVTFTDASTGGPTAWLWDFGDGSTSTLQNPAHTYGAGTFAVSLRVTNAGGTNTLAKPAFVTAGTPPVGSLVLSPPTPGTAGVSNTLVVTGAVPNAYVGFVSGQVLGSSLLPRVECPAGIPIAFGAPYRVHGLVRANAAGVATFVFIPPTTSAGKLFYFQAFEPGTCKTSNQVSDRL
jgi:galactose oxidase-like protein/carboxypeptidase family protein/PKD domain-containing protein/Kelch motif protein